MPRTLTALGLALGLLPWAAAQETAPTPDLRVQVHLKNGSSIVGIAPGGCLSERPARSGYEHCPDKDERKSGIRVWYYRNLDGFIFLPYKTIGDVKVLNALDASESRILREAAARARAAVDPKSADVRPDEARTSGASGELTAEETSVLRLFPPDRGWSTDRYGEIQRRRIVNDVQPAGDEARFVESYPTWEKALKKSTAQKPADPPSPDQTAPRPSARPRSETPPGG